MSNRNLGKGLAIALGVLGAGNMLTPAMSAMEEDKCFQADEKIKVRDEVILDRLQDMLRDKICRLVLDKIKQKYKKDYLEALRSDVTTSMYEYINSENGLPITVYNQFQIISPLYTNYVRNLVKNKKDALCDYVLKYVRSELSE